MGSNIGEPPLVWSHLPGGVLPRRRLPDARWPPPLGGDRLVPVAVRDGSQPGFDGHITTTTAVADGDDEMDRDRLLATMTAAFWDDPLYTWLFPDEAQRPHALRDNLTLVLDRVAEVGQVVTNTDATAVALWTAPGVELLDDPQPFIGLLERWAPQRLEAALAGMAACGAHARPGEAVLHIAAVDPSVQGRGVGTAALQPTLAELDADGVDAYLESSSRRNIAFYQRSGFVTLAEVEVASSGPTMRPMRRHAGGAK